MGRKAGVLLSGLRSKPSVSNVFTLQDQSRLLGRTLVMESGAFTAASAQAGICRMDELSSAEIPTFNKERTAPTFTDIPLRPPDCQQAWLPSHLATEQIQLH
jgi:hypothetical protein